MSSVKFPIPEIAFILGVFCSSSYRYVTMDIYYDEGSTSEFTICLFLFAVGVFVFFIFLDLSSLQRSFAVEMYSFEED